MDGKTAYKVMKYMQSISIGNKKWWLCTYEGTTVIRVSMTKQELCQFDTFNKASFYAMRFLARCNRDMYYYKRRK